MLIAHKANNLFGLVPVIYRLLEILLTAKHLKYLLHDLITPIHGRSVLYLRKSGGIPFEVLSKYQAKVWLPPHQFHTCQHG
jgi:hypothetical protein